MPRKKRYRKLRQIPVNQGSLAYISAIWIKPLLKLRPEGMSVANWLNYLFCTHQRAIKEYLVKQDFVLPGKYRVLPTRNALGKKEGYRKLNSGSSIWARVDSTIKNRVEVETQNAQGGKPQLFELTAKQWKTISSHYLKPAPKRRKRRKIMRRTPELTLSRLIQRPNVPKVV